MANGKETGSDEINPWNFYFFFLCLLMLSVFLPDKLQPEGGTLAPRPTDTHTDSRPYWVTIVPGCGGCSLWGLV